MSVRIVVFLVAVVALWGVSSLPVDAFIDAGACGNVGSSDICNRQNDANITPIVQAAVNILLFVAGVVAVIFAILGGFKFMTSAGDASKAASGRNTLLYAVIGVVAAALSYAIANYVFTQVV